MAGHSKNNARQRRHTRIRQRVSGTPAKPRMNVFRSLSQIYVQIIDDTAGHTLAMASSLDEEIKQKGDKLTKSDQARKVGELVAQRALAKDITQVVFDRGGYRYIGRVKALAEGARGAGLRF